MSVICSFILVVSLQFDIPITVLDTWQPAYASEIQGICMSDDFQVLCMRSNADGVIYLADPADGGYLGEVPLPPGCEGFGLAYCDQLNRYFIDDTSSMSILSSDGSDSWTGFSNPQGAAGAGLDFEWWSTDLHQCSAQSPYTIYSMTSSGTGVESHDIPGITGEISGFTAHEIVTMGDLPSGSVVTTRHTHDLFFYWGFSSSMNLYGQEDCPLPVLESLGLTSSMDCKVYWSYLGGDSLYYVSTLYMPIFGAVDQRTQMVGSPGQLCLAENPCRGTAMLSVALDQPGVTRLDVFDLSGRLVESLCNGELEAGMNTFSFSSRPGLYLAVFRNGGMTETAKVVLTD